jgi:hypothetical protein
MALRPERELGQWQGPRPLRVVWVRAQARAAEAWRTCGQKRRKVNVSLSVLLLNNALIPGIFLNFPQVQRSTRKKIPFGTACHELLQRVLTLGALRGCRHWANRQVVPQ